MDRLPVIDVEKIVSPNCSEEDWNIISKEIGDACLNYGSTNSYF